LRRATSLSFLNRSKDSSTIRLIFEGGVNLRRRIKIRIKKSGQYGAVSDSLAITRYLYGITGGGANKSLLFFLLPRLYLLRKARIIL